MARLFACARKHFVLASLICVLVLICCLISVCLKPLYAGATEDSGSTSSQSSSTVGEGQQVSQGSLVNDEYGIGINDFSRRNKGQQRSGIGYVYRVKATDDFEATEAFVVVATEDYILVMVPQSIADDVGFDADDEDYIEAFMEMLGELDQSASEGGTLIKNLDVPVYISVGETSVSLDDVTVTRDYDISDNFYVVISRTDGQADNTGTILMDYGFLVPTEAVKVEAIPTWMENFISFLSGIDYRPLYVSLKTSFVALFVVFILGLLASWKSLGVKSNWQGILDTIFTIPMVLPPTVCGFLLLLLFGNSTGFGKWLIAHGIKLVFSWPATVIAATVVAFPLMYRTARGAFEALDSNMLDAARTLGWSETRIFFTLMIPNAWPSIAAGTVLAFARAMGEFGATLFCAGNYAGITQTMPIAIYFQWMGGNTDVAIFWVIVVIIISFLVILFINIYTAHSQRYRKGGLTRQELKMLKQQGKLAGDEAALDQSGGINAANAEILFDQINAGAADEGEDQA